MDMPFKIFKFRTMTTDVEKNGAQWATKGDARRRLQYDLFYIKNFTLILDIQILIRTVPVVMKGSQ